MVVNELGLRKLRRLHLAIILTSFFVLVATQVFTAPALVGLLDLSRAWFLSDDEVIKVHLLLGLVIVALALVLLWLARPVGVRLGMLVIATLLFTVGFSISTLVLDPVDFLAEGSRMAGATGAVLLLAALGAWSNAWLRQRDGIAIRVLWTGLAVILVLAAADELFALHERAGYRLDQLAARSGVDLTVRFDGAQDAITLAYALGAVAAIVVLAVIAPRLARKFRSNYNVAFLAGAFVYMAAVLLDNFPANGPELLPTYDLFYAANAVEEVLELAAAGLLLSACLWALLEANGGALAASLRASAPVSGRGASRTVLGAVVIASAAFLIGLIHVVSIQKTDAWATEPQAIEVASRRVHPDLSPDGLATAGGVLYIANDTTGTVIALEPGADARLLAGREQGLVRPEALGVGPNGTVYVTDDSVGAVFGIAPSGAVSKIAGPAGALMEPKGIAFDPEGNLLLADAGARKIFRVASEGLRTIADFADIGSPEEIATDARGTIFVTQEEPPTVYSVTHGGRIKMLADASAGLVAPESIAVWDDRVYVADSALGAVVRLEQEGVIVPFLKLRTKFRHALEGLVIDGCGEIFVGLRAGRRSAVLSVGRLGRGRDSGVLHAPGQDSAACSAVSPG